MAVKIHPHAEERPAERGIAPEEAISAVEEGEESPARFGRTRFRRNFPFEGDWRGKNYHTKQVEVYAVKENEDWIIITVISKYF